MRKHYRSPLTQKVWATIGSRQGWFTIRDIASLTSVSTSRVSDACNAWAKLGYLKREKLGQAIFWKRAMPFGEMPSVSLGHRVADTRASKKDRIWLLITALRVFTARDIESKLRDKVAPQHLRDFLASLTRKGLLKRWKDGREYRYQLIKQGGHWWS
ncbi:MAG: hypothetical protein AAF442_09440 [Pseudomonadota bacterium]